MSLKSHMTPTSYKQLKSLVAQHKKATGEDISDKEMLAETVKHFYNLGKPAKEKAAA